VRYTDSCGACPHLGSDHERDLSRRVFQRKREAWADINPTVVTPSEWLSKRADESRLFGDATVVTIPNAVDTDEFRPQISTSVREQLSLSNEAILVGAGADWDTPRKGIDLLFEAMDRASLSTSEVGLVLFGRADPAAYPEVAYDTTFTGFVDDTTLRQLYADLDVVVVPSREEAFGQTASEALASGTPVVAFDSTGPADIVSHERTGYLARSFDPTDLANGIEWVLDDERRRSRIGRQARAEAVNRFDAEVVAEQYAKLYENVSEE
jgi:glycosyltransferase involved in cell wall biosynthesis